MKRCDRPSLDACNKYAASIVLVLLHEITRSLLGWYSDQWYALVGGLEPNDLWLVWLSVLQVTTRTTIAVLTFSFLLLLRSLATRSQETEGATLTLVSVYYDLIK